LGSYTTGGISWAQLHEVGWLADSKYDLTLIYGARQQAVTHWTQTTSSIFTFLRFGRKNLYSQPGFCYNILNSHIVFRGYFKTIFFFGATAQIWALAYLHETLRFTSVFYILRQLVGLLGRVISSSQGSYLYTNTEKHTHIHTNTKHLCPEWDSNPRFRLPSERKQCMPHTARLPLPAKTRISKLKIQHLGTSLRVKLTFWIMKNCSVRVSCKKCFVTRLLQGCY
jgi:hypothetical protein